MLKICTSVRLSVCKNFDLNYRRKRRKEWLKNWGHICQKVMYQNFFSSTRTSWARAEGQKNELLSEYPSCNFWQRCPEFFLRPFCSASFEKRSKFYGQTDRQSHKLLTQCTSGCLFFCYLLTCSANRGIIKNERNKFFRVIVYF